MQRKMYTIEFSLPSGRRTSVTATNETLQDMMVGPMSRSDESRAEYPPRGVGKELAGVPIKYVGEKAAFEFRDQKKAKA